MKANIHYSRKGKRLEKADKRKTCWCDGERQEEQGPEKEDVEEDDDERHEALEEENVGEEHDEEGHDEKVWEDEQKDTTEEPAEEEDEEFTVMARHGVLLSLVWGSSAAYVGLLWTKVDN